MKDINEFDLEKCLIPIWKGKNVYAETVFVLEDSFGQIRPKRLAYPISKIVSVRSFDLKRTYKNGIDYEVNEYGELVIKKDGNIPRLSWKNYRLKKYNSKDKSGLFLPAADGMGAYILGELFSNADGMSSWTLAVSYTHDLSSLYNIVPKKSNKIPHFLQKLQEKNAVVVSYGDSITYGWAASGMQDINKPPYTPKYVDMVVGFMRKKFDATIRHENLSVSGMCSDWAEKDENIKKVVENQPDLVILAFGMNDAGGFRPEVFKGMIKNIIYKIRQTCPRTEFLLVSPLLPNPLVGFASGSSLLLYHKEYPRVYAKIEEEEKGIAYANVTEMYKVLEERKSFQDLSSNNANHPNDFMHRIYAQVILKTLFGKEF